MSTQTHQGLGSLSHEALRAAIGNRVHTLGTYTYAQADFSASGAITYSNRGVMYSCTPDLNPFPTQPDQPPDTTAFYVVALPANAVGDETDAIVVKSENYEGDLITADVDLGGPSALPAVPLDYTPIAVLGYYNDTGADASITADNVAADVVVWAVSALPVFPLPPA